MRPSYERLKENGAYLLEDGFSLFLWIGRQCSPEWILQVLGAPHYQAIDVSMVGLNRRRGTSCLAVAPPDTEQRPVCARARHCRPDQCRARRRPQGPQTASMSVASFYVAAEYCEAKGGHRARVHAVPGRGQGPPPPPPHATHAPQLHDSQSYVDYLCLVHREIQVALS